MSLPLGDEVILGMDHGNNYTETLCLQAYGGGELYEQNKTMWWVYLQLKAMCLSHYYNAAVVSDYYSSS